MHFISQLIATTLQWTADILAVADATYSGKKTETIIKLL